MILLDEVFVRKKKRVMISHLHNIPAKTVWSKGIDDLIKQCPQRQRKKRQTKEKTEHLRVHIASLKHHDSQRVLLCAEHGAKRQVPGTQQGEAEKELRLVERCQR